jgi:hypothetical protein
LRKAIALVATIGRLQMENPKGQCVIPCDPKREGEWGETHAGNSGAIPAPVEHEGREASCRSPILKHMATEFVA